MLSENFSLPSSDGITSLNVYLWTPDAGVPIRAWVQFVHGMCEHMGRYAVFAEYLTSQGFAVIGHDHLGHGSSLIDEAHRCYFAKEKGWEKLIADMFLLTEEGKKRFPGLPNFILGHSMGSFLLRYYLTGHSRDVSGALILGTGWHNALEADLGLTLCFWIRLLKGEFHRSRLLNAMILGSYNKRFEPCRTRCDWLSSSGEVTAAYINDPYCGKLFTVSAWADFFKVLRLLALKKNFSEIRRDLPIYLLAGADDPVGGAKAVPKVRDQFVSFGMRDVTLCLCPGARHECLREACGPEALTAVKDWMEKYI